MTKKRFHKLLSFLGLAAIIIGAIILFSVVTPEQLVNNLGMRNGYLLAFFVSLFGGFSAGGSVTFIGLLITLTLGGLNPIYLGLISGISLTIGDIFMYYVGSKGRDLVSGDWDKRMKRLAKKFEKNKVLKALTPVIAYLYIGFAPLPNDLLLLFLASIKYPRKRMWPIILLGDLTFALTVTLIAAQT